jgi:tetratricopeptide (TPR) repeat protein
VDRHGDSVLSFEKAAQIAPNRADVWRELGLARVRTNNSQGAVTALNRCLSLDPRDAGAWSLRGFAYGRLADWDGAAASYDKVVEFNARDPAAWNARGLALMHLRRFDEAMKSFDVALSRNPGSEAAIEARKLCEERAAIARIEAGGALRVGPESPGADTGPCPHAHTSPGTTDARADSRTIANLCDRTMDRREPGRNGCRAGARRLRFRIRSPARLDVVRHRRDGHGDDETPKINL